ncbi:MAG: transposase [Rhodobacteraceae bacterium GWE1_64_9]|uniref:IS21 family transposase n=1 Tax=Rhodanobacter denitrificans TaxID=666685 RepID=A0A2W5JVL8_9GAMM|nr:MAG: transposase [Rhodobacteraceae bacterium GWE1_64_9]PZQ09032.1 MAG: IS21 family transposase [Rhodanobacter denitrificans]
MKRVELYQKVRRAVLIDGMSRRAAARYFGIDRKTIDKMLCFAEPAPHGRSGRTYGRKLSGFTDIIDKILGDDRTVHSKQRHTAARIFERLRDEHGFTGGITIVRDYVASARLRSREVFIPLSHKPGHAQVDFGEADGIINGKLVRFHYFCMDLPHSDAPFFKAYPAEVAEAFCEGHVAAFAFFGGIPQSILYDNTKLAVAQILGDGKRERSRMFSTLQSHYLFEDKFGRPGKGNDKGKVEGLVGYVRRHFMVPMPVADSFDALNARFLEQCVERRQAVLRGNSQSIGERMSADLEAFMPLPAVAFDPCHMVTGRASSMSLVRYRTNDYSVPTAFAHREVVIKAYVERVEIISGGERIAVHPRSYEREDFIANPLHYLALLEQKPRALDQAAPLDGWVLAEPMHRIRRLMEARSGKEGRREFIQVLRLCERFDQSLVEWAVGRALDMGAISFDAVKMIALARLEQRVPRLDLQFYPHLPRANVGRTDPRAYMGLLTKTASPAAGVPA